MIAIPAIDLKDGKIVRLLQGRYEEPIVYSHDAAETAKAWQKQGATRLHVVDLDGALAGEVKNTFSLRQIIENSDVPVQFGGGLRTREDIAAVISMGAKWAILGTKACEDIDFVQKAIAEFPEQIIVSIDVKYKKVAARGWTETAEMEDIELIKKMQDIGAGSFIYTAISRDGTLAGADVKRIAEVLRETSANIIYSGGISSLEDVRDLMVLSEQGLFGIIIGRALYEDKIHLSQIIRLLGGNV
jgi:phosphoribosylformimino-5-aminoimidazole carboxamide ribotide isomerase